MLLSFAHMRMGLPAWLSRPKVAYAIATTRATAPRNVEAVANLYLRIAATERVIDRILARSSNRMCRLHSINELVYFNHRLMELEAERAALLC
jgi:hypothetical protein